MMEWFSASSMGTFCSDRFQECGEAWSVPSASGKENVIPSQAEVLVDCRVPPEPAQVKRLAGSYRNASLGELVVRAGRDEVVFQFGGWKSRMATKLNPDGTTSFISIDPGVRGFEFNAPAATGVYARLRLRDPQHTYDYESESEVASPRR